MAAVVADSGKVLGRDFLGRNDYKVEVTALWTESALPEMGNSAISRRTPRNCILLPKISLSIVKRGIMSWEAK